MLREDWSQMGDGACEQNVCSRERRRKGKGSRMGKKKLPAH